MYSNYKLTLSHVVLFVVMPLCSSLHTFGAPEMRETLRSLYREQSKIPQLIAMLGGDEEKSDQEKDETKKKENEQGQSIADYYVNLKMVISDSDSGPSSGESVSGKKKAITLEEILPDSPPSTSVDPHSGKVLILGGAGVGKSTLMQRIAHQWATDKLWSDRFAKIYKVSFKQYLVGTCKKFIEEKVKKKGNQGKELEAFIAFSLEGEAKADAHFATLTTTKSLQSDRTLLLVDGYDEVQHLDEKKKGKETPFSYLKEAVLSYPRLIMTTRPNAATYDIKRRFDYLVENEGLGNDGIEEYLKKQFDGDMESTRSKVSAFLHHNPSLREICRVPVNISMLCSVIKDQQSAGKLPDTSSLEAALGKLTTMGALYKEMLTTLCKRFVTKEGSKYRRGREDTELRDQINNGELTLIELKVLEYIAHDRFTAPNGLVFEGDIYLRRGIEHVSQTHNVRFNEKPTRRDL